jgi:hypothetical protein
MVIPLNVQKNTKVGTNILEKKAVAGKCKAVLEEDGKVVLSDERLCDARKFVPTTTAQPQRHLFL